MGRSPGVLFFLGTKLTHHFIKFPSYEVVIGYIVRRLESHCYLYCLLCYSYSFISLYASKNIVTVVYTTLFQKYSNYLQLRKIQF